VFVLLGLGQKISDLLTVERVDPLADNQGLMQEFDLPLLLLIFAFDADHVDVALQVHRVNVDELLNHPVQQINPAQTNLCVGLVRLCVRQFV
jgi:hypothetical protein